MRSSAIATRAGGALLALAAVSSLVWVGTPVYLIRPFSPQTPRGVAVAYALKSRSGMLTAALLLVGVLTAIYLAPRLHSWKSRVPAGLAIALLGVCAWLARQNHFEWMFNPLPDPAFVAAEKAVEVAADDMVLGVQIGGEAHAYPVRSMAYHHVVNDVIAGEPVVATY